MSWLRDSLTDFWQRGDKLLLALCLFASGYGLIPGEIPGGGVDEYHAEAAGRQAQGEQNAVPFLKKLPKGREQGRQVLASLEKN